MVDVARMTDGSRAGWAETDKGLWTLFGDDHNDPSQDRGHIPHEESGDYFAKPLSRESKLPASSIVKLIYSILSSVKTNNFC